MKRLLLTASAGLLAAACASHQPYESGVQTVQYDPATKGPIQGVGIEGQDIVQMADLMMRDILAHPLLGRSPSSPRVILDAEFFKNESAQRINTNIIIDNLRVNLQRAAGPRMTFVSRESMGMVAEERNFKRDGITTAGMNQPSKAQLGADYRLRGRITSTDQIAVNQGLIQRYNQIIFEMIDLESSEIVWTGMYNFARAGADDVVYR